MLTGKKWGNKLVVPVALIIYCFTFFIDSGFDKYFWIEWSREIMNNGLCTAYLNPTVNNPPVILYLIKLFTLGFSSSSQIDQNTINFLKPIVGLFDIGSLLIIISFLKKWKVPLFKSTILVTNIAFWYNTIIWGQMDIIPVFFILLSFWFITKGRWFLLGCSISLAINTKLQSAIFLPFIFAMIIPVLVKKPQKLLSTFSGILIMILLIWSPFIISSTFAKSISLLWERSYDFYPVLSKNAFNMWHLMSWNFPEKVSDAGLFLFQVNFKQFGLFIFLICGAVLTITSITKMIVSGKKISGIAILSDLQLAKHLFLSMGMVSILFFFFNTQMHERYVHPAIIFIGIYAILDNRYWSFSILSLAYFLNLEAVFLYFYKSGLISLNTAINYSELFIFNPKFVAALFLLCLAWLTIRWLNLSSFSKDVNTLLNK